MRKVPPLPEQIRLRTGDRARIEVCTDRAGFLTVFNVGPTGDLILLHPDDNPLLTGSSPPVEPNRPLQIADIEMKPPAGRERLFAVWSRHPLPLRFDLLHSLVLATSDMKRVQQSVQDLGPEDWHAVTLELDHAPPQYRATR
jgi:hypothetical protein